MTPADARSWWTSAKIPSDQFMLYAFGAAQDAATKHDSSQDIVVDLYARACRVADLNLRVMSVPGSLDRPYWVAAVPQMSQCVSYAGPWSWQAMLSRLGELMAEQLDATDAAWKCHIFDDVRAPPGFVDERLSVVVLQVVHALGDGRTTAAIARELFGRPAGKSSPGPRGLVAPRVVMPLLRAGVAALGVMRLPGAMVMTVGRGVVAYRKSREAQAANQIGAAEGGGVPLSTVNHPPGPERTLRTLTLPRAVLCADGRSVTIAVLTAISVALPEYLGDRGTDYAVELTVGREDPGHASHLVRRHSSVPRNNFRNMGIDLGVGIADLDERATMIGDQIRAARERDRSAAQVAARRAEDSAPAILTRLGVASFDPDRVTTSVTGNTVVSSVNRGSADFALRGGQVRFTAGFPGLSPAQGLTHGVHGLGDTVTISLTSSPRICPDLDRYLALLQAALT